MSALEQLKGFTKVVADTGDFEAMAKFQPEVCSTVPKILTICFKNLSKVRQFSLIWMILNLKV